MQGDAGGNYDNLMPYLQQYLQQKMTSWPSMVAPGNINLNNRPIVKNPDGSISTVRSISVSGGGKIFLIPTVSDDGKIMSNADAIRQFLTTGRHLGEFSSEESAKSYADALHEQQAKQYGGGGGP